VLLEIAVLVLLFYLIILPIYQDSLFDRVLKLRGLRHVLDKNRGNDVVKCMRGVNGGLFILLCQASPPPSMFLLLPSCDFAPWSSALLHPSSLCGFVHRPRSMGEARVSISVFVFPEPQSTHAELWAVIGRVVLTGTRALYALQLFQHTQNYIPHLFISARIWSSLDLFSCI